MRRTFDVVFAIALFAAGLRWVWNSNPYSGPVVLTLGADHGLHANDWLTLLAWAMAFGLVVPASKLRLAAHAPVDPFWA